MATFSDLFVRALTLAQNASPTDAEQAAEAVQVQSVWDFIIKGGPVMIPIIFCSLIAFAVVIERVINLRRSSTIPPAFLPGLQKALSDDGDGPAAALDYCKKNDSPVSRVFAAGIKRLGEPAERLEHHIQEAGEREALQLRRRLRVLQVIAAVAPLLGLLGTIFGMINAFQTVAASGEALGRTELLAEGIYEAMITTAAGLIVAIPVLVCYHWVTAKVDATVIELDRLTVDFVEAHGDWAPANNGGVSRTVSEARTAKPALANGAATA